MSARIVFHVVETTSKDISRAESSLEAATTRCYLTSYIEMEAVVVSPRNNPEQANVGSATDEREPEGKPEGADHVGGTINNSQ